MNNLKSKKIIAVDEENGSEQQRIFPFMRNSGRVRPLVLALVILVAGLLLDKWWWHVGGVIMIVIFIEAFYRYRTLD